MSLSVYRAECASDKIVINLDHKPSYMYGILWEVKAIRMMLPLFALTPVYQIDNIAEFHSYDRRSVVEWCHKQGFKETTMTELHKELLTLQGANMHPLHERLD